MTTDKARAEAERIGEDILSIFSRYGVDAEKPGAAKALRELFAAALTARDTEASAKLARVEAALVKWQHEAEGLRGAVRVLAKFIYENGRGCGTRTATERDDDMKIHRGNLYANPIAKAALDAAGGAQ